MKKLFMVLSLATLATASYGAKIDGFKDIKFGMSMSQVESLGFTCKPSDNKCNAYDFSGGNNYVKSGVTIFNKPVKDITVYFNSSDKASEVSVGVNVADSADIRDSMKATFGTPKVKNVPRDKNRNQDEIIQSDWNVGSVTATSITILGSAFNSSSVVFTDNSLAAKKVAPKPSKDF